MKIKNKFTIEVEIEYDVDVKTPVYQLNILLGDMGSHILDMIRRESRNLKHGKIESKIKLTNNSGISKSDWST